MVLQKIKDALSGNDEKYEVLYLKYSQLKAENKSLIENHQKEMYDQRYDGEYKIAKELINLHQSVEEAKKDSFNIKAYDKDTQKLLISLNKVDNDLKEIMKKHSIEIYSAEDRFYDPEIHEIASYHDANGMNKGIIIKTSKPGYKYKNQIVQKPRVVVTR